MVRSQESIGGVVGVTLGNAPYSDSVATQLLSSWCCCNRSSTKEEARRLMQVLAMYTPGNPP